METPSPLPIVLTLAALLDGLLEAVAARYGVFPIRGPLLRFLWTRFSRVKRRFATLAARFAAGKVFPPTRPPRPRHAPAPRRPPDKGAFRLRHWVSPKFGWLCRIASESIGAGAFAAALRELLTNDAEMRALLAATPATARMLRPLCHMLGVPPPPPPVVSAAAACAPPCAPLGSDPRRGDAVARAIPIAAIPRAPAESSPPDPPLIFFKAA